MQTKFALKFWSPQERADAILAECAERGLTCDFVPLVAGHCPHDDVPEDCSQEHMIRARQKGDSKREKPDPERTFSQIFADFR